MILSELNALMLELGLRVETGTFSGKAPEEYCVITPLTDQFIYADNVPTHDIKEARISLFSKKNYLARKSEIEQALLAADFTLTNRYFVGYEEDTGYNHLAIDVAKSYDLEEAE
jgi:hypothetical protein